MHEIFNALAQKIYDEATFHELTERTLREVQSIAINKSYVEAIQYLREHANESQCIMEAKEVLKRAGYEISARTHAMSLKKAKDMTEALVALSQTTYTYLLWEMYV